MYSVTASTYKQCPYTGIPLQLNLCDIKLLLYFNFKLQQNQSGNLIQFNCKKKKREKDDIPIKTRDQFTNGI